MIRFLRRNLKQAEETYHSFIDGRKELSQSEKKALSMLKTIRTLLDQQTEFYKKIPRSGNKTGLRITDRIVSIYKEYVRPIPRGKIPVSTEFGAKTLLELKGGFMHVLKISFNNDSDCSMLKSCMKQFSGCDLGGDRGFHSPENSKLAKEHNIRNYCIEPKGRKKAKQDYLHKQMRKKRSAIEAKISLAKRKYGLDRNRYSRGTEGESQWIHLGIAAMNLNHAFRVIEQKKRKKGKAA